MVVFEEIPNEITLAINLTNCPCHCKGCHSKFLWENKGTELTIEELDKLIDKNDGITTVCFMGGDAAPEAVSLLAEYTHEIRKLKVGWYSGMDELSSKINLDWFNYVKIGHYDEESGPLNKETTNQKFFYVYKFDGEYQLVDMTSLFWKKVAK